ncbi:MAG: cytochrome c [Elusimicrobia bacterium]|nr:cytochrome c [Elusimicrobiota bacterium]
MRALLITALLAAPAAAFDGAAAAGLKDWRLYCAACHGDDGRGKRGLEELQKLSPGTLDLTNRDLDGWPDAALEAAIAQMARLRPGLKESHSLSSGTVAGLVAYLRIVGRGDAVAISTQAWSEVKDPGERAYLRACAPCHGRSGSGIFDTGWSSTPESGVVDLRPPLPKRKVRKTKSIKAEWISFEGELTKAETSGLLHYLEMLEAKERARSELPRRKR